MREKATIDEELGQINYNLLLPSLPAVAGSARALILNAPGWTDWVLNVERTDTFFPIRPKPDLHTPSLVTLGRRSQLPVSSAMRVPQQPFALPELVEGQAPYLFQGRQPCIDSSMIAHLGIVRRSRSLRLS